MAILSKFNNTYISLGVDGFFLGALESTDGSISISSSVFADVPTTVIIRQYRNNNVESIIQLDSTDVPASTQQVVQFPVKGSFYNVAILNQSGGSRATVTQLTTYLQQSHYVNLDVRKLSATEKTDSVLCYGVSPSGFKLPFNVDASGNLIVVSPP